MEVMEKNCISNNQAIGINTRGDVYPKLNITIIALKDDTSHNFCIHLGS